MDQSFKILYTKSGIKKRKTYQDGKLIVLSTCLTLVDDQGKEIYKKKCHMPIVTAGEEMTLGIYEVQVEESCNQPSAATTSIVADPLPSRTTALGYVTHWSTQKLHPTAHSTTSTRSITSTSSASSKGTEKIPPNKKFVSTGTLPSYAEPSVTLLAESGTCSAKTPELHSASSTSTMALSSKSNFVGSSSSSSNSSSSVSSSTEITLDTALIRVMRPHQIEAANFLIRRLLGEDLMDDESKPVLEFDVVTCTTDKKCELPCSSVQSKTCGKSFTRKKRKNMNSDSDNLDSDSDDGCFEQKPPGFVADVSSAVEISSYTGAILADEMGLGKTLTAISVLWSFVRRGGCKGVIVCPSSLVDNWEKEIKKWMGVKLKALCVRSTAGTGAGSSSSGAAANSAEAIVSTFRLGHITMSPVLIISYEMFRKHAAKLNMTPKLDIIICDEGHRLKNASGTKTIVALADCKAKRRIILSGTPIQNDLDELYAVVSFVTPGFLGSLSHFKSNTANLIILGKEPDASKREKEAGARASDKLRALLSKIMMRRTQAEILKRLLPPRTDVILYCGMTDAQEMEYEETAEGLRRSLGITPNDTEKEKKKKKRNKDSGSGSTKGDDGCDYYYQEAEEDSTGSAGKGSGSGTGCMILPGLQRLRSICNTSYDVILQEKQRTKGALQSDVSERIAEELDYSDAHEGVDVDRDVISSIVDSDQLLTSVEVEGICSPHIEVQAMEVEVSGEETLRDPDLESDFYFNSEVEQHDVTVETAEEGVPSMSSNGSILVSVPAKQIVRHAFVKQLAHAVKKVLPLDSVSEAVESAASYVPVVKTVARSWVVPSKRTPSEHSPLAALNSNSNMKYRPLSLHRSKVKLLHVQSNVKVAAVAPVKDTAQSLLSRSGKLQVLDFLLTTLRTESPKEKAVLVSNFTSSLDQVQTLALERGWGILRIDGSVPTDKRQSLVDSFNRTSDLRFLFLLSSKAGGVGINLIGGSRLIMFDCDWNPAVDKQAMSRVWREGQTRPVYIYRLVANGRIEDAILQRQRSKAGLASVMSEDQEQGDGSGFGSKMPALSLTKKDVMQLMHPKAVTGDTTSIRTHGKVTHPATQSTSSSTSSTSILQDRETADAIDNDLIDEEKRDILSPLHRFLPQGSGPKDSILEFALTHFDEKILVRAELDV